ncbi:MAG TPA: phospholipase D-like domain-containing protein [Candidatus Saccharimonadia bacterium]|nr:phospholipase D-like domain-containing protein [Candidatus Saccharimonadia bacterium]
MLNLLRHRQGQTPDLATSRLFDEDTFYPAFIKDLENCGNELIIESPFITTRRLDQLLPILLKLKQRKVRIIINTRDPHEHDEERCRDEAHRAIARLQKVGIHILYTGGHHRKLVIVDRAILYEGSLNVLSQNKSSEIMRRIESTALAWQMVRFVRIDDYL